MTRPSPGLNGTANLATIPDQYYRAWLAGYGEGFGHGIERAHRDIEATDDRMWTELSRRVRGQAASPRFSQLCDRRGEHDRAEAARELERRNGLEVAG